MFPALAVSLLLSWVQVRSDTFIVRSSAGEDRALQVLQALEAFHQVVGKLAFERVGPPEIPIEVLVLGSEEETRELAPQYNGRSIPAIGYYQGGEDRDFIVLTGRISPQGSTQVIYHELTHYFIGRLLKSRPVWLNEGLAEYFATTEIRDTNVFLGAPIPERVENLEAQPLLPLTELFAVDHASPYYNERSKANIYYLESWALVHFLLHEGYADNFRQYLDALTRDDASLPDYLGIDLRQLEREFRAYVTSGIRRSQRHRMASSMEPAHPVFEPVEEAVVHVTKAEILLAMGSAERARIHIDRATALDAHGPRVSYVRGMLAGAGNQQDEAREFFVDALPDPIVGPLAAIQLITMREFAIPGVREALEAAGAAGPRVPAVYWALAEMYLEDRRRIEEIVRLNSQKPSPLFLPTPSQPAPAERSLEPQTIYSQGGQGHFRWELQSTTGRGPVIRSGSEPYYPDELIEKKVRGEVVLEVEIASDGAVAGLRTVSATPEILDGLAVNAVREWKFDPQRATIIVVVRFLP